MGLKPFSMNLYINTECITTDNYDEATVAISMAVREAITSEQEQTTGSLPIVAAVFMKSAAFINEQTSIEQIVSLLLLWAAFVYTPGAGKLTVGFPHLSDCAEPGGHCGWPATMECRCVARKCFKVSAK